jgi:hypothetical protein
MSRDKKKEGFRYNYGDELLKKNLKKHNVDVVRMSVTILSEANPSQLEPYAIQLLETGDQTIKKGILRNIDPSWRKKIAKNIAVLSENDTSEEIKNLAMSVCNSLNYNKEDLNSDQINTLLKADTVADRMKVAKQLINAKIQGEETIIEFLLNDSDRLIKISAIKLAAKKNNPQILNKLIELLKNPQYSNEVANCLLDIGDKVLPELEKLFEKKANSELLVRVVEIYAKMGSTTAKGYLVKNLNYPNREIQIEVIRALYFCRFQANSRESTLVHQKLEEVINNILWIFATLNDIETEKNTLRLVQSLDFEREDLYELIFELLSFLYDSKIINLIQKNIIGENTIFALEIIDNFIGQDLKQLIIPLFDDIPRSLRLKKLAYLFPQEKLGLVDRLKDIIIRDYTNVEPYTIAKSVELLGRLHRNKKVHKDKVKESSEIEEVEIWSKENVKDLLAKIRKSEMPDEIFACLYHPDEIVFTTAAQIIYEENPGRCLSYMRDLAPQKQALIPVLERGEGGESELITKKIRLIKKLSIFFTTPENLLVKVARMLHIIDLEANQLLDIYSDNSENIFCIVSGKLVCNQGKSTEIVFNSDDIIIRGLNTFEQECELKALKKTTLLVFNRYKYFNILSSETRLIHHMFEMIASKS